MKFLKGLVILLLLAGVVTAAVVLLHRPAAAEEKAAIEARAAVKSTKETVVDAVQASKVAAGKIAADVADEFKAGAQKAGTVATNVAAKAKHLTTNVISKVADVTTNVVDQARQTFERSKP